MATASLADTVLDPGNLPLPPFPAIADWQVEEAIDSVGDPAIYVQVTLKPHPEGREYRWEEIKPIQDAVFTALRDTGEGRFPYVFFQTADRP